MIYSDQYYMRMAISLARQGLGLVSPNPLVGCVIVRGGEVVGKGYHHYFGGPHAEIYALKKAGEKARGGRMFVTLEPCVHYGKTAPCVKPILDSGIKEVVVGMPDPNPLVNGKGIKVLSSQGLRVKSGILEEEICRLNESYVKFITTRIPFCILKTAMTLDGKIATGRGESRWISNEKSRTYVHKLRSTADAVLVGINTVLKDNPRLLPSREYNLPKPIRVVVDTYLRFPLSARMLSAKTPILIFTSREAVGKEKNKIKQLSKKNCSVITVARPKNKPYLNLRQVFSELGKRQIGSVLVEGGGEINASCFKEKLVNKILFFIAPKIIGGNQAPTPVGGEGIERIDRAIQLKDIKIRRFKEDILIEGYVNY